MIYCISLVSAIVFCIMSNLYLDKRYSIEGKNHKRIRWIVAGHGFCALMVAYLFPRYGYTVLAMIKALFLISFSTVMAYIDEREQIIPNKLLVVLLWASVFFRIIEVVNQPSDFVVILGSAITGGLLGGGIFLTTYLLYRSGIGAGDVKLFAVMGLFVGNYTIFGIMLISLLLVAIAGVIRMIRKKFGMKQAVPFGPYIAIGVVLSFLLGF